MKAAILLPLVGLMLDVVATPVPSPATLRSNLDMQVNTSFELDMIPLNEVLDWISTHFPFNITIHEVGDLIVQAENELASAMGISTVQDTVVEGQCATTTLLFARGTDEVGNVGIVVGPEFIDAVAARLGTGSTLAVRGTDYPASVPGFLEGGDPAGGQKMQVPPEIASTAVKTYCG